MGEPAAAIGRPGCGVSARSAPAAWLLRLSAWTRLDLDPPGRIAGGEGINRSDQHPVACLQRRLIPRPRVGGFFAPMHGFSGSRGNHRRVSCWIDGDGHKQTPCGPERSTDAAARVSPKNLQPAGTNSSNLGCIARCGRLPSAARRRSTPLPPQSSPPLSFFHAPACFVTVPRVSAHPSSRPGQGHRAPAPQWRTT